MFEKTSQCISNCFNTLKGSHVFYRSFGLNDVDAANMPMRRNILIQLSTYYPDVKLNDVTLNAAEINGHFSYNVNINGEQFNS